jgi:hypothetical protein
MSFCGHCGYLLAPNIARCPRCGTPVETPGKPEEMYSDMPTVHSQQGNMPSESGRDYYPQQSISQQEATQIAGNDEYTTNSSPATGPYHSADAFEQTATPHGPAESFYPPQTPSQTPSYPNFPASSDNHTPLQRGEISYPGFTTLPTTYPENSYPAPPNTTNKKSSVALVLAIIAFILAATLTTVLLLARPGLLQPILSHGTATPIVTIPSTTVATRTPEQQARMVIEQYFNSINRKDYQKAYNLWNPPPSNYKDFANGFAHTRHDYIKLGAITQQNDGTVQVPIVITALTDTGTREIFSGYYIVGQQPDGSWKITSAKINQGAGS